MCSKTEISAEALALSGQEPSLVLYQTARDTSPGTRAGCWFSSKGRGEMRPKPGLNRKMGLAFASAMLTLLVVGAISYRDMVVSRDNARWVSHTHEVLESIYDLVFAVENIGSNSRGFALT